MDGLSSGAAQRPSVGAKQAWWTARETLVDRDDRSHLPVVKLIRTDTTLDLQGVVRGRVKRVRGLVGSVGHKNESTHTLAIRPRKHA